MRFIEAEDQLRLLEVADFRKLFEELREQPEQERRIQARLENELVGGKDADDAAAAEIGAHQIGDVERRLAKEGLAAVVLEREQRALNRRDRRRARET